MIRYPAAGGSTGVGSNHGSGGSSREARGGLDSSFPGSSSSSFTPSSRRAAPLVPYKLKCDKESLSQRFGPPDFYPPAPNCPEEVLNRETCVQGYKELVDGIDETSEVRHSLTSSNTWNKPGVNRYKDEIRKRLRVLNNALIRKRKAGQVYGVPLSGNLLGKPSQFPEPRPCGEDFRRKWIEDLSQRKRLRSLADHVPPGYRKRAIFETLIKHDVPILRATWFVKIMYLTQVRPMSIGMSAGGPDKSPAKRVELWTKDVLDFVQSILDEFCQSGAATSRQSTTTSSSLLNLSQMQKGGDARGGGTDGAEIDLLAKWRYMLRLTHWHHSEGLIHRTQLVEWVLKQLQDRRLSLDTLQDKRSVDALEMLLPLLLKLIDEISLSQTHVRNFVDIALHWLRELCPSGSIPNSADRPQLRTCAVTLTELLRYLLVTVPDTFVALDCFPLPSIVCPANLPQLAAPSGDSESAEARILKHKADSGDDRKKIGVEDEKGYASSAIKSINQRESTVEQTVDRIQKRAASLAKAVNPGLLRNNEGKVVWGLDWALMSGDIQGAYNCVFGEDFPGIDQLPDDWQADVIPGYGRTPSLLRSVNSSELLSLRFLCEWAVCEFRDSRGAPSPSDKKAFSVKDMSRVYMAVSVLSKRSEDSEGKKLNSISAVGGPVKLNPRLSNGELNASVASQSRRDQGKDSNTPLSSSGPSKSQASEIMMARQSAAGFFESAGPLHDLIVAWLDQHDLPKGESFERLQLLLYELVRLGLFWPDAYVRQLLCTGVLERSNSAADVARAARHKLLLQHLPLPSYQDGPGDASCLEAARLNRNERYLALHGYNARKGKGAEAMSGITSHQSEGLTPGHADDGIGNGLNRMVGARKEKKLKMRLFEVKQAVASFFSFPESCVGHPGTTSSRTKSSTKGVKRRADSPGTRVDREGTPGCEECSRSKRLKANEGKAWNAQAAGLPTVLDEEDTWWQRKEQKMLETVKHEPPPISRPSAKPSSRGRPKIVRKTGSLAHLAAARIEGAVQSATSSNSHQFDSKIPCPYHRSTSEGQGSTPQNRSRGKPKPGNGNCATGNAIKGLRLNEKRSLSCWLDGVVRGLIGGGNGNANPGTSVSALVGGFMTGITAQGSDSSGSYGSKWRLNERYLAKIVYIMDVANDFHTLLHLLLWLLPMAPMPSSMIYGHGGRGLSAPAWNRENSALDVAEASLLSYLRRYENILAAMDLVPQALRAGMQRASTIVATVPGWRPGCSALLSYVWHLLKKYASLDGVHKWEKNWKTTCDSRLSAELETLKAAETEGGYGMGPLSSSGLGDDRDEPIPQRLTGRLNRVGTNMKEIVNRFISEAVAAMVSKERDLAASGAKDRAEEGQDKLEEGYHAAQKVVGGVMDTIRQNGSGQPQADSALVATAVSLLANSAGLNIANVYETLGASVASGAATGSPLRCARQVLQMHVLCLRLLKEALGDRHSRMVEVALGTEANVVVSQAMQQPPGRSHTSAAAVASFVAVLAVQGVITLERMVTVLKMRDQLETLQHSKTAGTSASGMPRTVSGGNTLKDHVAEAYIYWFRVLIGDSRTVGDGLVGDLVGEANMLGLYRLQRLMPLRTIFLPAYALFALVLRRPQQPVYVGGAARDTVLHAAVEAVNDVVAHEPFRDVCLRDTHALYSLLSSDAGESEYAAMLDMQGSMITKLNAMVPFRARLFLRSLLDRGLPSCLLLQDETWGESGRLDVKTRFANERRQTDQLVQGLDELQPATFHWQWLELRLLLNEEVFIEKLKDMSAVEAVHAAVASLETRTLSDLSECEKTFTEVVLTRLLVRPDAAALYSEAIHNLGRALEEYLILQVKWALDGNEVLLGRKSLHQLLDSMANRKGFSTETQRAKMWGWLPVRQVTDKLALSKEERKTKEIPSPEEGEVADSGVYSGKDRRLNSEEAACSQQFATEKALADLVLPCLAHSSNETCTNFTHDLIKQMKDLEKQMSNLDQQMAVPGRSNAKSGPTSSGSSEALVGKGSSLRRGARGGLEAGSPGLGRKVMAVTSDSSCLSAGALQTSMWLRLQFLLPLLPIIQSDREQTPRNMRQSLAPVLLKLLGSSVVQEAAESLHSTPSRDQDKSAEAASVAATAAAGEGLFDRLLSVLHALLSSTCAVWLKSRSTKLQYQPFDREAAERMQNELDRMQLPRLVRTRLRAALPLLPPAPLLSISAGPPVVSISAQAIIQPAGPSSVPSSSVGVLGIPSKPVLSVDSSLGKAKSISYSEQEIDLDPWLLLEDGVGSGPSGGNVSLIPACHWLKGALRVRRTDLTYVGPVDEDS